MKIQHIRYGFGLTAMALSAALLQGCGGGGGTAGNAVTPTLNGTVTGFGSVIVDGQEVEDAYARVVHENADGSLTNDVLQMGQRVRVAHDGAGKASQVLIDAAVIGAVSAIDTSTSTLTVAGQVVTVNADSAAGPVTVFGGGYTDLSSVVLGDLVQVHGTPVYDTASSRYKVQATRIQKDAGQARVQLSGKIEGYTSTATGAAFTLNGLSVSTTAATAVRPAGSTLANALQVTAYGGSLSAGGLTATHVRVNRDQNSGNTSMQAQLSGAVSNYNASAGTFELQGSTVKIGAAALQPAGASVADRAYVLVKGSVGTDGVITATQIQVRTSDTSNDLAKVLLIGTISDYVDENSFVVRGVPVDASNSSLVKVNCPATFSQYSGAVKLQATQQVGTAVVKATRIECQPSNPTQLIKPLDGNVSSVDSAAKTFVLTWSGSSQTVKWTDTTTFLGLTVDSLSGKTVHVDGYTDSSNGFMARVVRLDDDSNDAPKLDDRKFRRPRQGNPETQGWAEYRAHR